VTSPAVELHFEETEPTAVVSDAVLGGAIASLKDGFAMADARRRLIFFNPGFAEHLSESQRSKVVLGTTLDTIVGFDLSQWQTADLQEHQLDDGRWINARRTPLADGGLVFILRDITYRKSVEMEIAASEARYRNVVNAQTEFVVRFTPEGRVTFSNDAYCRYMGREPGVLPGEESDFDLIHEDDSEAHQAHILSLTPEKPTQLIVFRSVMPDGIHWEEWTDTGVFDEDGHLLELQAVGRDVTDRKKAELTLAESEARYRNVVNTQTEFVARFLPDGTTTFANDAYCRYMGMAAEELQHPDFNDFYQIHAEDRARHDEHIKSLSPQASTKTMVFRTVLPDGTTHWEQWTHTGVFDEFGRLIEIQAVGSDITKQRATEDELDRQRDALHQTEKLAALGSLLAGVAHELNNPLSIVVGYAGVLHEFATDEATKRRAKEVHVAAERCARIIKTFLAMARSKPAMRTSVDIETQLESVLELTGYGIRTSGIEVNREFQGNLPTTYADGDQLHQVFMNLVLNAQQAMMNVAGPRTLSVCTAIKARDNEIEIKVADTGIGMPDHVRQRIFEPFFTTKPQGVGTGIGLAVVMSIIEAHSGRIDVSSIEGVGSCFRIYLPIVVGPVEDRPPVEKQPTLAGSVLVVDDEPAIADLIATALRRRGVSVSTATGGLDAIRSVESQNFDAVLTDLRMADLGGDKLVEIINVLRPELAGRIIVMTGDALGAGISLKQSNITVLEKPIDFDALFLALAPMLKVHSPS